MTPDVAGRSAQPVHDHAAAFYDSGTALQRTLGPYVRDGLDHDETVLAVVSDRTRRLLYDELGPDAAERVEWLPDSDPQDIGPRLDHVRALFRARRQTGTGLRLISERDRTTSGRGTLDDIGAYLRYEALSNEAFAPFGHRWTCLYDTRSYSAPDIGRIGQVHSTALGEGGRSDPNPHYIAPATFLGPWHDPLRPTPGPLRIDTDLHTVDQLHELRAVVRASVTGGGTDHVERVVLVVNEIATNALLHGRPPVQIRGWSTGGTLIVQVIDHGNRPVPSTAGYWRPLDAEPGIGLWLARNLCDAVRIDSDDRGTRVQVEFVTP